MSSAQPAGSRLIPSLRYQDAHAAINWLERALGFVRHAVYDGPDGTVAHAELTFGGTGMVMLGSASNTSPYPQFYATPAEIGGRVTSPLYLVAPDCAPIYARAQAAGSRDRPAPAHHGLRRQRLYPPRPRGIPLVRWRV
jgi:uncharacterized glyoxalase superfamily protein PhnB